MRRSLRHWRVGSLTNDGLKVEDIYRRYASLVPAAASATESLERPLSVLEHGLWIAAQSMRDQGVRGFALLRLAFALQGPLNVDALVRAIDALAAKHDILRTSYSSCATGPRARVHARVPSLVRVIDLRDRRDAEALADAECERETANGFDLEKAPLHRFVVVRITDESNRLYHFAHHLTCDGMSYAILFRELAEHYAASSRGAPPSLGPQTQYSDVARWQGTWLDDRSRAEHAEFWKRHLPSSPVPPPLSAIAATPPSATTCRWAMQRYRSAPGVGAATTAFASVRGLSAPTVLFATLVALLHFEHAGGAPIGYMSANRRKETISVLGLFASMLPIRVALESNATFEAAVARVTRELDETFLYQDLPPRFSPMDAEPPFRVVFSHRTMRRTRSFLELPNVTTESLLIYEKPRALFDLWLNTSCGHDGPLEIEAEYNRDLVSEELLSSTLRRFERLLARGIAEPDRGLHELLDTTEGVA